MNEPALTARALLPLLGHWRGRGVAYRELADRIRLLILDGRVSSGTRLPAERELAAKLGVSRATITSAYRDLRERGVVESVRGSGTVAKLRRGVGGAEGSARPVQLDLSRATLSAAPQLPAASIAAAHALPRYLDRPGADTLGLSELRAEIADRYTRAGLPTRAEEIMVTLGGQHAIGMVARLVLARGDRALVEHPSYPYAHDTMRSLGARVIAVPVTSENGWDAEEFVTAIDRSAPALAYLMPDFHNPTGATMDRDTRRQISEAAARQNTVLLIDETTADLRIDRPGPFVPFAVDNHAGATVLTVGTVTKTVWGGIRLGWIRADAETIRKLAATRSRSDLGTSVLEQLTVLELFRDFDTILRERSAELGAVRDAITPLLRERFPTWRVPHIDGGLALWVGLDRAESSQLALHARNHGLLLAAGPRFGPDGAFERFLRIPITAGIEDTARGIELLSTTWHELRQVRPRSI